MTQRLLLWLTLLALSAPVLAAPPLVREDLEPWLDGLLPAALQRGDVAGAVIVVVKDGRVLLQKGYGLADVAARRPMDAESTLIRPGSVSKLFTWTAVMQQVEQGRIDLDRDVNTYLDFTIPPRDGQPITMRHLMTHSAGFPEALKDVLLTDPAQAQPLADFLRSHLPPRVHAPGEIPAYSNYGAALAGYIVQRVSGQSFEAYTAQHVFAPLGMRHTTFAYPVPAAWQAQLSNGYELGSGPAQAFEIFPAPAGSAVTTAADMSRFMLAHLQPGTTDAPQILRPATLRLMQDSRLTTISPQLNRMGLGFLEFTRNGRRVIGHDGETRLHHSQLQLFLDDRVGFFVSFNSNGRDEAARGLRTALAAGFADRYFPDQGQRGHLAADAARAQARQMAGAYDVSYPRFVASPMSLAGLATQAQVSADEDGVLSVSTLLGLNGQPRRYEAVAPWVWQEIGGQHRLAAKVADGRVVMWAEDTESAISAFLPTPAWRSATWLLPTLVAALATALLAALGWPIRLARPWARWGAAAAAAVMGAWLVTLGAMVATFTLRSSLDPWLTVLHLASIAAFPLAAGAALWNAWTGWRGASVTARLASLLAAAACLVLLWVALAFHLVGFGLAY